MKIVVANSRTWFKISEEIHQSHEVVVVTDPGQLTVEFLSDLNPAIIFFPHWNWIVKSEVYDRFTCIVFHTAPLPFGRGGSPIQNLILRGVKEAPVCAIKMSGGLDAGPVYDRRSVSLAGSLSEIFSRMNHAVNELILSLCECLPEPQAQEGEVVVFKRLSGSDNHLPDQVALSELYDRIRMLDDPSYPSAYIEYGDFIIEFESPELCGDAIQCRTKISMKSDP